MCVCVEREREREDNTSKKNRLVSYLVPQGVKGGEMLKINVTTPHPDTPSSKGRDCGHSKVHCQQFDWFD